MSWIAVLLAVAARLACMSVWPVRAFSSDLKDWRIFAATMLVGADPFTSNYGQYLDWPPMWLETLYALAKISDWFDWQFFTCVRVFLIAADAILVLSTFSLLKLLNGNRPVFVAVLFGLCLNPLLILLTIQQANFDVIPTIFVLWFLYFLIQSRRSRDPLDWLYSAASLGLAAFAKTYPLALLPLLISSSRPLAWKVRMLGAALCIGPTILSLAPLYVLYPADITQHVLRYRGTPGVLGVSGLILLTRGWNAVLNYSPYFTAGLLLSMAALTVALWRRPLRREPDLVLLAAIILIGLFEFGAGYCLYYWMWVASLLVVSFIFQPPPFRILLLLAAIVIVVTTCLTLGYDVIQGSSIATAFPNSFNFKLRAIFSDDTHDLILISLPMTVATLLLWIYACQRILLNWTNPRPETPDE